MTNQEKKEYLQQYAKINREIDREIEELAMWRARATKITPTISDMPKGGQGGDRIQQAVDAMGDIQEKINADVDRLIQVRRGIEASISTVDDTGLQSLLKYRYIDGMTWEQIAVKMFYTYQWVCTLHGKALQELIVIDTPSVLSLN